jgi:hypothetical protein
VSSSDHVALLVLFAAKRAARNTAGNTARIVTPAIFALIDIGYKWICCNGARVPYDEATVRMVEDAEEAKRVG